VTDRRQLAVDLFIHVWTLLEKPDRTPVEDDEMVHVAHASRFYGAEAGTAVNLVRAASQISYVYEAAERRYAELARREGAKIVDADNRELLEEALAGLP
jgi:hypothetical protein